MIDENEMRDMLAYGIHITKGGKRVAPEDFYAAPIDDPYSILKGWIAYAEERPYDRDAQELRKLSEACIEKMMPLRDMRDLGSSERQGG